MIDYSLSDEQQALVDVVHRFSINEIRPAAEKYDSATVPEDAIPMDLLRQGMSLGFSNLLIPEEYGGYGGNMIDYAVVVEELAYGDVGIADLFLVNISLSRLIQLGGSEKQKSKWLSLMCESADRGFVIAGAMTEPTGGSEIFCPLPEAKYGVRTKATKSNDDYVLDGSKCFITNGGIADLYIVLARTAADTANMEGCSIFLVPADSKGIVIGKTENKMGHRLSSVREISFDSVLVAEENRLGDEGEGFMILLECYEGNGVGVGSSAIGLARAAYDAALEYSQQRNIWGRPIIQFESVAAKLADMRIKIEAARALVWKVAWSVDNPDKSNGFEKLGSMAKIYPASIVREITANAMDIFAGTGYMRDLPIEKYVRDAMLYPIYDGTNDLLKQFMAQQLTRIPSTIC